MPQLCFHAPVLPVCFRALQQRQEVVRRLPGVTAATRAIAFPDVPGLKAGQERGAPGLRSVRAIGTRLRASFSKGSGPTEQQKPHQIREDTLGHTDAGGLSPKHTEDDGDDNPRRDGDDDAHGHEYDKRQRGGAAPECYDEQQNALRMKRGSAWVAAIGARLRAAFP